MKADNIFQHTDGDFYCLLSTDSALKEPTPVGIWHDAAIYVGTDGRMRSTTLDRWNDRFRPVAEYTGDDESVMQMIRRCNPGDRDLDFVAVFESWHESEINITGHMLELAVGAMLDRFIFSKDTDGTRGTPDTASVTITTEDLQRVVQNFEIERVPQAHGFTFKMRKSFPDDG